MLDKEPNVKTIDIILCIYIYIYVHKKKVDIK